MPIQVHVDLQKPFIIATDASNFASGSILSQHRDDGKLHPMAFQSRKIDIVNINYEVHDNELFAKIYSFAQWHHILKGFK